MKVHYCSQESTIIGLNPEPAHFTLHFQKLFLQDPFLLSVPRFPSFLILDTSNFARGHDAITCCSVRNIVNRLDVDCREYRICACISRTFFDKNLPSKIGVRLID
jgi:hypothetical protein